MVAPAEPAADPLATFERFRAYAIKCGLWAMHRYPWIADQVESEILYRLWRMAVRYPHVPDPRKLVARVARCAAVCVVRSERSKNPSAFGDRRAVMSDGQPAELAEAMADHRVGPDVAVEVNDWLDVLDPGERAAVEGHVLAGESFEAIGRRRGESEWRTRLRYGKAVERMQAAGGE